MAALDHHLVAIDTSVVSSHPESKPLGWDVAGRTVGDAGFPQPTEGWILPADLEHSTHESVADLQGSHFESLDAGFHGPSGGPVSSSSPFQEYTLAEDDGTMMSTFGGSVSLAQGTPSAFLPGQSPVYLSAGVAGPTATDPCLLATTVDGMSAIPVSASGFSSAVGSFPCSSPIGPGYEAGPHSNGPVLSPGTGFYARPPSSASMSRSMSTFSVQNDCGLPLAANFGASMEASASASGYQDPSHMSRVSSEMASSLSSDSLFSRQVLSTTSVSCGDLENFCGGPVDPLSMFKSSQDRLLGWHETLGGTPGLRDRGPAGLSLNTGHVVYPQSSQMVRRESWHRSPASAVEHPDQLRANVRVAQASSSQADAADDDVFAFSPTNAPSRRLSEDSDLGAVRNHPWYHLQPGKDGLYHCPLEGREECHHRPETLKCNYHKHIDSHLKPYRCKVSSCSKQQFSSTACLLRHEREAHGMHGHGDKPFSCPYKGCERSEPGNGFPRKWNLADHKRRVHDREGQGSNNASSATPNGSGSHDAPAGSKRKGAVSKRPKARRNSKNASAIRTPTNAKPGALPLEQEVGYNVFPGSAPQRLEGSYGAAAPAMRATQSLQGDDHHQMYSYLEDPRGSHVDASFIPRSETVHRDFNGVVPDRSGAGFQLPFFMEQPDTTGPGMDL